ncbi:MAG: endonuclease III [Bdellovibrionales bacterium]|nr:endonuclease III [Bdellovibrionales bacterium]
MRKESKDAKAKRVGDIIRLFKRYYPDAHCALDHENADQLLVATILSAQCTDDRVNIVTKALFKKYPDIKAFSKATQEDLEELVRPTGFFRSKAKNILLAGQKIQAEYRGKIPQTLEELVLLPGVGRKTANVVLGNAFGIASGVVVDTHVRRLSYRLGLTKSQNPEIIERELVELVPKKHWVMFSHWLITHGRRVCKARKPQCDVCFLFELCPRKGL